MFFNSKVLRLKDNEQNLAHDHKILNACLVFVYLYLYFLGALTKQAIKSLLKKIKLACSKDTQENEVQT